MEHSPLSNTPAQDLDLFEPAPPDFFDRHKTSIIGGIIAVVLLIVFGGVVQVMRHSSREADAAAFYQAQSIEELQKIIATDDGIFQANASLLLAERYRDALQFDEALSVLEGFETRFKKYPLLAQAALSRAATLETKGELNAAMEAYRDVSLKYPESSVAPYAMLMEGRLLRLTNQPEDARKVLENAITRFPGTGPVQEAIHEINLLPAAPAAAQAEPAQAEPVQAEPAQAEPVQ